MNLIADEGVDRPVIERLRQDGHDVVYVAELAPSVADEEVLQQANAQSAVLLTADKDFGELVFRQGLVHSGVVLLRLAGLGRARPSPYPTKGVTLREGRATEDTALRQRMGSRASVQFKFFNNYTTAERDTLDALILDEAHRLRPFSNNRFTPAARRSRIAQVEELVNTARVSVFFIDDLQVVRPGEIGSSSLIRDAAEAQGVPLYEFELDAQFRCNGSEAFINWVDNTLQIRRTPNVMWDARDPFEFRIVDSVQELERLIRRRHTDGFTARLAAGFCWNWSDPTPAGQLVPDVKVGDWTMPWNAKPDAGRLAAGIPTSNFWASDPRGLNQVGCVYTAQGFEFDYCGVIFGRDLRFEATAAQWVGDHAESRDPQVRRSGEAFLALVKNTYRVLLTRGLKGCYVFFQDEATRAFVRGRIE